VVDVSINNGAGSFSWAVKFDPSQLAPHDGSSLTKIKNYWNRSTGGVSVTLILRIYQGAVTDGSTLLLEQTLDSLPIDTNSEVVLDSPILLDVTKDLWITLFHAGGEPVRSPATIGLGPAIPNGDLVSTDGGVTWALLSVCCIPDLGNWLIQGFVTP